ncbi:MAG: hypothetical protein DA330_04315 [Nitrososphaera sp.]|nr:hypothetical protein [Nitrososphaera sp.]
MIYFQAAKKARLAKKKEVSIKTEGSLTVSAGKKSMSLDGTVLSMTNEYGNTVTLGIDAGSFDGLWDLLWQFVKDRQH